MTKTTMRAIFTPQALAAAVALGCCAQAQAVSFNIGEIEGQFDSSLSVGASWGMRDADKKLVGTVNGGWPLLADIAVTTRKDNGLIKPIHTALEGAIAGGQYEQVLQRWGLDVERVDKSLINPPGLPD